MGRCLPPAVWVILYPNVSVAQWFCMWGWMPTPNTSNQAVSVTVLCESPSAASHLSTKQRKHFLLTNSSIAVVFLLCFMRLLWSLLSALLTADCDKCSSRTPVITNSSNVIPALLLTLPLDFLSSSILFFSACPMPSTQFSKLTFWILVGFSSVFADACLLYVCPQGSGVGFV